MNKKKHVHKGRRLLSFLLTVLLALGVLGITSPVRQAKAAAGEAPAHDKTLTVNKDGTYTLALNVTGDSEKKIQKVNVIVIVDRSGSMGERDAGNRRTRLEATATAVNSLANSLLANNGRDGNPSDTVEMALVSFATSAQTNVGNTTDYSTFSRAVNNLNADGGTNWEAALQKADSVSFGDEDPTYVIFFSDGAPTFYSTDAGHRDYNQRYGVYGSGQEEEPNMGYSYTAATDEAASLAEKVGTDNFYTIFAYGENFGADYMTDLTDDAGAPAENNYSASDTAALEAAFAEILEKIEMAGIGSVALDDGTTSSVTTTSGEVSNLLTVDASSYKYYRAGGAYSTTANNGLGDEWTDAPTAAFENGSVKWDLESVGILENGVTYTVTFDCWPSQTTLDIVADIKNDPSSYDSLDENIKKYIDKDGNLKTNTTATLSYDDTRTDEQEKPVAYVNPDPVTTTAVEQLAVSKKWENELDGQSAKPLTMNVLRDGESKYTVELSNDNNWKDNVFISIGILRTKADGSDEVLSSGHDFTFTEPEDLTYHWELDVPTVHPMLVNGELTMLIKVDEKHQPGSAKTHTINGAQYFEGDASAVGLTATNYRRSSLNLTKVVTGEDIPEDAKFPFTLNVVNANAASGSADNLNSDYWVWFSVRDKDNKPVNDAVVSGATAEDGSNGWYYAKSSDNIVLNMMADYNIRINNLPSGSTYTFTEGTLPTGFIFDKAELSTEGTGTDSTFSGGVTTTGTIESTNTLYTVTYTNKYALIDINVDKVWDDADNQDGKRPEELALTLNGLPEGTTATPEITKSEDGNTWTYTWKAVPRYDADGNEIAYTVTEDSVPEGYTCTGSPASDGGQIKNTHAAEVTAIQVTKVWDDINDIGGIRPESIQVQLTADGEKSGDPVTLNAENSWTYKWENLPKYKAGQEIKYAADEVEVPTGYTESDPETGDNGITITNVYTPQHVIVDPPVQKIITGTEALYNKGDFTFEIANTEAPKGVTAPMPTNTKITNSADYELKGKQGFYEFGNIEFAYPGTYVYTVTESGSAPGVTNDPEAKTITFTVTDDGQGSLSVTPTTDEAVFTFNNTYNADGEASLSVTKALGEGSVWPADKTLTLTLSGEGGTLPETTTKTLTAAGTAAFDPIKYTLADAGQTYIYTISEDGFGAGWTGSDPVTATVTVSDLGGGKLGTEIKYSPENATITNTYAASGSVELTASKKLEGRNWKEGETVTFTLVDSNGKELDKKTIGTDGEVTFAAISYTQADVGEHTYTIKETAQSDAKGTTPKNDITATVTVTDNGDGTLTATPSYNNDDTIVNTYTAEPVKAQINIAKTIDGYVEKGDSTFTFEITGPKIDGKQTKSITTANGAGTVALDPIEFTFDDMVDENGSHVTEKEFTYTVKETQGKAAGFTYDTKEYPVVVKVTDDQEGHLSVEEIYKEGSTTNHVDVHNTYSEESTSVELTLIKKITDLSDSAQDGTFTFQLLDGSGALVEETTITTTDLEGSVKFAPITYNYPAAGTYNYTLKEIVPEEETPEGWTYDTKEYPVEVIVTDNIDEAKLDASVSIDGTETLELTITNTYRAAKTDATLVVEKIIEDASGSAYDTDFTFTLAAVSEGAPMPANTSVTRTGAGEAAFDAITYEKAGTYVYEISENAGSAAGYTYDDAKYTVTVTVEDQDGKLVPTLTYAKGEESASELTFTNIYEPTPAKAAPRARKVVEDRSKNAPDETFIFQLLDGSGTVVETKSIQNGGYVDFSELTFDKAGTYSYTIQESAGGTEGFTYDAAPHAVSIEVTGDGKGGLVAAITYADGEEAVITNSYYKAAATTITPKAKKVLTGRDLAEGEFEFTFELDGTAVETVKNAADGTVTFSPITFDYAGEHAFRISEVKGSLGAVTYDDTVYAGTITVTDNGEGQLVAEMDIDPSSIVFNNTYKIGSATVDLTGKKVLTGRDLAEGEFEFRLEIDGETVETVKNGKDGSIVFSTRTFEEAGEHTYKISEVKGNAEGVTYDTTVYEGKITVADNGEDQLVATVEGAGEITFNNKYEKQVPPPAPNPAPPTGDPTSLFVWMIVMLAALFGAVGVMTSRRRK